MTITIAPSIQPGDIVYTTPARFEVTTLESVKTPGWDTTNYLVGAETPTSPVVVCWDQTANALVTLTDSPSVTGNVIVQPVRGSALTARHLYLLRVTFTASVTDNVWEMDTQLYCPL